MSAFYPEAPKGKLLGGAEYNHIGRDSFGPLKADHSAYCPRDLTHAEKEEQCVSLQEHTWGTDGLARLEAIKSGDESGGRRPPSLFFHYTNLDRATREDDLRVGASDGVLHLRGSVASLRVKESLLDFAARIPGVRSIAHAELRVRPSGGSDRSIARRIRTLLDDLTEGIPVLATTATANQRVTEDVQQQLGRDVLVLRGSLDRESLRLGVVHLQTADQRLAWLADHLAEQPGSGIVYCLTVAATQEVADYLRSRGHEVAAYSGQTETTERQALEGYLAAGRPDAELARNLTAYGDAIGLAFQIQDDILDVTMDTEQLGKPSKSDEKHGKSTFPALLGLQASRERAQALCRQARAALAGYGDAAGPLQQLADYIVQRSH